jgi:hypothetical protein
MQDKVHIELFSGNLKHVCLCFRSLEKWQITSIIFSKYKFQES